LHLFLGEKMIKNIIAVIILIVFTVFVQEKIVEQDIRKAIISYNDNPSFTKETINEADFNGAAVTIFTATWCGYCKGAKQLLNKKGIAYFEVDVEEYNISKRKLKEIGIEDFFVPQIFVDGIAIGGFSDLKKIFGSDMPVPKVL
tara:strand:+ start:343 stop:774 length:432 start_codon:yes stop_codon:yes gene_type:complete